MKIANVITCMKDEQLLMGEFIERTEDYISVKIGYPFKGWINEARLKRTDSGTYFNYLNEFGMSEGKQLLIDTYNKLVFVNQEINTFVSQYSNFRGFVDALKKLENKNRRDRMIVKLKQWFFNSYIFKAEQTGFLLTPKEIEQLEEILLTYLTTGERLYFRNEIDIEDVD